MLYKSKCRGHGGGGLAGTCIQHRYFIYISFPKHCWPWGMSVYQCCTLSHLPLDWPVKIFSVCFLSD